MDVGIAAFDNGLWSKVLDYAVWAAGGVVSLFVATAHRRLDKQDSNIEALQKDQTEFKLLVTNDYAKNHSLEVITRRIDNTLDEIRGDIKTLLQR